MTGAGSHFRIIAIKSIVETMDEKLSLCLPGFHAFTGDLN